MDNELPADFQKELDDLIMKHTLELPNNNDYQIGYEHGVEYGIEVGSTEYATKLHTARTLLEKFISRHEAGLLPDRIIYDEIKTFLDGTK